MLKDERMAVICSMVRDGAVVCDVGTDHAIIPAELLKSGKCSRAVITDISVPSLEKGIKNIKKEGLEDKVSAFAANGTLGAELDGVTDIVIAGMGGELIAGIIAQDERLKSPGLHFILQPMSRAPQLRTFLYENGFEITDEKKASVERRVYAVINAEYTGVKKQHVLRDIYLGPGEFLSRENVSDKRYAEKELEQIKTKIRGIDSSAAPLKHAAERSELEGIAREISDFLGA